MSSLGFRASKHSRISMHWSFIFLRFFFHCVGHKIIYFKFILSICFHSCVGALHPHGFQSRGISIGAQAFTMRAAHRVALDFILRCIQCISCVMCLRCCDFSVAPPLILDRSFPILFCLPCSSALPKVVIYNVDCTYTVCSIYNVYCRLYGNNSLALLDSLAH